MARPFLKWAGGKTRLLPELLPRLPARFETYYEPFLGGGALFFALAPARAVLGDTNAELINAYLVVRDRVDELIEVLRGFRATREEFYARRSQDPASLSEVERAARFIYLNRTCYNGLWRVNARGQFNVPFGRYKNPRLLDEDLLREASSALCSAEVRCCDFAEALNGARPGDFVYLDPPYLPVSETSSFTEYSAGGFSYLDQVRLSQIFRRLTVRGVFLMLSNSDTPEVRRLYEGFRVERVFARRAINSRADRRGPVSELLIRNY